MKKKLTVVLALVMLILASAGAVYASASTEYVPPVTAQCCGCTSSELSITPFSPPAWENGGGGGGTWGPCCTSLCGCSQPPWNFTIPCSCPRVFIPF